MAGFGLSGTFGRHGPTAMLRRAFTLPKIVALVFLLLLVWLVLWPFIQLVLRTLTVGPGDQRMIQGAVEGDFTGQHWAIATTGRISEEMLWSPIVNTLVTGGTSAAIALVLGGVLAWIVVRTDIPGRGWLKPALTLSYVVPSFSLALAWETLFKNPSFGGRPGLWEALTGLEPALWVSNGAFPIIVTMTLHYFPFAFLLAMGALVGLNAEVEEQATILGATKAQIIRRISLPLLAPAMAAAFILIFAKTMGTFALPYLLGAPVEYHTISSRIFSALGLGLDAIGYILSIVLIVITGVALFVSSRMVGKNEKRYQTIGGKGFRGRQTPLGGWRWPVFTVVAGIAFVAGVLPLLLLAWQSLMLVGGQYGFENLTLHYWLGASNAEIANGEPGVAWNDEILGATWNTLKLAFIASAAAASIGLLIGYIIVREKGSLIARALEQLSFLPFLFPGLALAAMYLTMFSVPQGPIPALYGTFFLLVLLCTVDRLPYGVRTGASSVMQIGTELEEAATLQGAGWWTRFRRIAAPLASGGMIAAFMVCFVGIMRELSLIIILVTPDTRVLMSLGLRYSTEGFMQMASAIILIVTVLTLIGEFLVWRFGKNRLAKLQDISNAH
jgi:iron(III) transport system permease protein